MSSPQLSIDIGKKHKRRAQLLPQLFKSNDSLQSFDSYVPEKGEVSIMTNHQTKPTLATSSYDALRFQQESSLTKKLPLVLSSDSNLFRCDQTAEPKPTRREPIRYEG